MTNYDLVPTNHMLESVRAYIETGRLPGGFLAAVITNDFRGAACKADPPNYACLREWAQFFYCEAPRDCHGSLELMDAWVERGGLQGGGDGK